MTPDINFESLSYSPFSIHENSINSEHDTDIDFYQDISSLRHITTFNVTQDILFPFYI